MMFARALVAFAATACATVSAAQDTRDLGLPAPFDNPALPPAVNPALPPPTGQRYLPGTSGPFANPDAAPAARGMARHRPLGNLAADIRSSDRGLRPPRIDRLLEIAPALRACWSPPTARPESRLEATIRFSLNRNGDLAGEPRITYVNRAAPQAQRDALVHSMREALARCAPFPLGPGFANAVARRPIAVRFILDAPSART